MVLEHLAPDAVPLDLNGTGNYLTWGVIQLSWANAIVIVLMLLVFVLALLLPFPGHGAATGDDQAQADRASVDPTQESAR